MASENEAAKPLLPYLQRADELHEHYPLVAYYCRLYAMERGLKIAQKERTKTTNALLVSLMNQLEKDKKSVDLGPADNLYVEEFALNVFAKADKQDRAGRADLNTAKTFYAANIFFEILNQFGQLLPDVEQKQKYAAWKAADIRKALKEGRKPLPGPSGGDEDSSVPSNSEYDIVPSRSDSATKPDSKRRDSSAKDADLSPQQYDKALTNSQAYPRFTDSSHHQGSNGSFPSLGGQCSPISRNGSLSKPSQEYRYDSNYEPSAEQITEAQKAARFAVGALGFSDVLVAVEHLKKSLELLTKPSVEH